jgi:hypothetical protein
VTARSKLNDFTARRVTIDRVYAGILINDRCVCGHLADDHEAKLLRSHRFAIKCVAGNCRCTTFSAPLVETFVDNPYTETQLARMEDDTNNP